MSDEIDKPVAPLAFAVVAAHYQIDDRRLVRKEIASVTEIGPEEGKTRRSEARSRHTFPCTFPPVASAAGVVLLGLLGFPRVLDACPSLGDQCGTALTAYGVIVGVLGATAVVQVIVNAWLALPHDGNRSPDRIVPDPGSRPGRDRGGP